jgi:phosphoribosylformimino-5-aminoimidazole carboxamide ribotide isomerase
MLVIPAIDIESGEVVRLKQGRFDQKRVYSQQPQDIAKKWVSQGAQILHIVDLDGAREGRPQNIDVIISILEETGVPIELGGGIRTIDAVRFWVQKGARWVVLGTAAVDNGEFLRQAIEEFKERIIISLDAKGAYVAARAWEEISSITVLELAKKLEQLGVERIIYTDVAADGMLSGPNRQGIEELLREVRVPLTVSGGISSIEDIRDLKNLKPRQPWGVIVGKALYEDKVDLRKAIEEAS